MSAGGDTLSDEPYLRVSYEASLRELSAARAELAKKDAEIERLRKELGRIKQTFFYIKNLSHQAWRDLVNLEAVCRRIENYAIMEYDLASEALGHATREEGDEYRLDQSADGLLKRIEDYRTGYSCGYADGKNGTRMRDKDAACQFFSISGVPDVFATASPSHAPTAHDYVNCSDICTYEGCRCMCHKEARAKAQRAGSHGRRRQREARSDRLQTVSSVDSAN